jgi:HD superfamily phosphohydrolase
MSIKMIKDSIHGFIEFEGDYENSLKDLLSDPYFQRLRRVKQLGFSDYVFPSATHSRFAHSLGVYAVAKRMLSVVEPDVRDGRWSQEGKACLAAALLHDVGHGMFSHAFEKAMEFYFKRNPVLDDQGQSLQNAVHHETISLKIIQESSIAEVLKKIGGNDFPQLVADMVGKKRDNCIYTSIVSSQLDADRLDYAKRDPFFAGVSSGGVDLDWLIRNLKVREGENGKFLYVNSKAYISLEQFTVTLFQLYPTIYLHKKTRGLEYMFALLISRVFELIAQGKIDKTGISSTHPLAIFFNTPDFLENILWLDDTLFWGSLYLFQQAEDESINTLAKRIGSRKIYPMIDVWRMVDQIAGDNFLLELDALDRVKKLHEICGEVCDAVQNNADLWVEGCYYDSYDRPIYKPKNIRGGDPQQINIEVGENIVDIASISPVVASAASFNIHRIYFDDKDELLCKRLEGWIDNEIKMRLAAVNIVKSQM